MSRDPHGYTDLDMARAVPCLPIPVVSISAPRGRDFVMVRAAPCLRVLRMSLVFRVSLVLPVLLLLVGCASGPPPRGFDDPDPAVRIRAIKHEVARGARADLPRLVRQLEDDDPAVRLAATEALRELTGETGGFAWYDEPAKQPRALDAWRRRVGLSPSTEPTMAPSTSP